MSTNLQIKRNTAIIAISGLVFGLIGLGIFKYIFPFLQPSSVFGQTTELYQANQSSELTCRSESIENNLWVVNPDNDTVAILNTVRAVDDSSLSGTLSLEISTGLRQPTSISYLGETLNQMAVTYQGDDQIVIFNHLGEVEEIIETGYGTQPVSSIYAENNLYVALYGSGEVIKIDLSQMRVVSRLAVGPKPKAMALVDNRLLVTRFLSTPDYGEVYDIDTSDEMSLTRTIRINRIFIPDSLVNGSGVPNMLSSIVITPDNSRAYITAVKANIGRGLQGSGNPLDDDNTIRPMMVEIDLVNNRDANVNPGTTDGTTDFDNAGDPSGVTYLSDEETRVVAFRANNALKAENLTQNTVSIFETGFAPQSLCATADVLYSKNLTDRTVSAIDIIDFLASGTPNPPIIHISTVQNERLTAEELNGLQLFYHSKQPEMGQEGYISCASCHPGGGHDGMTWDMTSFGEGMRNTISLNGTSGTRFGDLHWSGNFDEMQDFELQIETLNRGTGLVPGKTFNGESPLELVTTGQAADLDALAAYIATLGKETVQRSPFRTASGELTDAALSGEVIFNAQGCATCHTGQAFRDGQMHDVGTITAASGSRLGGELTSIRTPTLIELWDSAPYFHDGSAATLDAVFTIGTHQLDLDEQAMSDLITFINSIDQESFIEDDAQFPEQVVIPSPTITATSTMTPAISATPSPTPTASPTSIATVVPPTQLPTVTIIPTETPMPTETIVPTAEITVSATPISTATPTPQASSTPRPPLIFNQHLYLPLVFRE